MLRDLAVRIIEDGFQDDLNVFDESLLSNLVDMIRSTFKNDPSELKRDTFIDVAYEIAGNLSEMIEYGYNVSPIKERVKLAIKGLDDRGAFVGDKRVAYLKGGQIELNTSFYTHSTVVRFGDQYIAYFGDEAGVENASFVLGGLKVPVKMYKNLNGLMSILLDHEDLKIEVVKGVF